MRPRAVSGVSEQEEEDASQEKEEARRAASGSCILSGLRLKALGEPVWGQVLGKSYPPAPRQIHGLLFEQAGQQSVARRAVAPAYKERLVGRLLTGLPNAGRLGPCGPSLDKFCGAHSIVQSWRGDWSLGPMSWRGGRGSMA
jgi:hypothetical protein